MAIEGVLLAFGTGANAAIADVLALLIDPEEIDVGIELIDELETGFLAGTGGLAEIDFGGGRFKGFVFGEAERFE